MKTVLVKYREWKEPFHWSLNGYYEEKSTVVKLDDLREINGIFSNVIDVKVLESEL